MRLPGIPCQRRMPVGVPSADRSRAWTRELHVAGVTSGQPRRRTTANAPRKIVGHAPAPVRRSAARLPECGVDHFADGARAVAVPAMTAPRWSLAAVNRVGTRGQRMTSRRRRLGAIGIVQPGKIMVTAAKHV